MHCSNMLAIFLTFFVLKLVNSKEDKVSQYLNIASISSTLSVFIFVKFKEVNTLQKENILLIFLAWLVLKFLISKFTKEEQL